MRLTFVTLTVPVLALFLACSGGSGAPQPAAPEEASAEIGPSGGLVVLPDGSSVSIPKGALTHDVQISIGVDPAAPALDQGTPAGLTYLLGPEGQTFDMPVTVTVAFDPGETAGGESASNIVVYTAPRDSSDYLPLATTFVDGLHVSVQTTHFSHFKAATPPKVPLLHSGDPTSIDVGFSGDAAQFGYYDEFFDASSGESNPGPRLCHWYLPWYIACADSSCATSEPKEATATGCSPSISGTPTLSDVACWLQEANPQCDEALFSFKGTWVKGEALHSPPPFDHYENAMKAFLAIPWSSYFKGSLAFTAWNEPNNGGDAGDGLGQPIEPERAAEYYLIIEKLCQSHDCKVAAGDLASNGRQFPNDYDWNCANDDGISADHTCKKRSPRNTGAKASPASYLDRYKNYIHEHWDTASKLKHPSYVAFHGWHDINVFLDNGKLNGTLCNDYSNCVTRRLSEGLSGSFWNDVAIWDTEVGVGQFGIPLPDHKTGSYSTKAQACGVAFLLNMTAMDERISRLYYMRLFESPGNIPQPLLTAQDVKDKTAPLAFDVLKAHDPSKAGHCWPGEKGVSTSEDNDVADASAADTGLADAPAMTENVCCALCNGQTTAYYAAQIPELDGGLTPCSVAAQTFCQYNFADAGVQQSELGTCSVYP
jgi:hypothetical protein